VNKRFKLRKATSSCRLCKQQVETNDDRSAQRVMHSSRADHVHRHGDIVKKSGNMKLKMSPRRDAHACMHWQRRQCGLSAAQQAAACASIDGCLECRY